jgi:CubicO group peptidase (beta-lactamase class C family)
VVEEIATRRMSVHSLLIIRHGHVVLDARFPPYDGQRPHDVASVTKSVMTTLVGIAIDRGSLSGLRQPVLPLFGVDPSGHVAWQRALTVEHLVSMTSGLACGGPGEPELLRMLEAPDWTQFALGLPTRSPPGTRFSYCSPGMHLLSGIVARATGKSARALAEAELFQPLGIERFEWPADDPQGLNHGWGDLRLLPGDLAKLGLLFLHGGQWNGRQIVSREWVRAATRRQIGIPGGRGQEEGYGYGWWIPGGEYPGLFEARGRGGQFLSVWPATDLIIVMTGSGYDRDLLVPLLAATLKASRPLPEDRAGVDRLAHALEMAKRAPAPRPVRDHPAIAHLASGRKFILPKNGLHLSSIQLLFKEAGGALLLERRDAVTEHPIGFDAVPRISNGPLGIPVALTGAWTSPTSLHLEYEETAGVNHFDIRIEIAPDGRRLTFEALDLTGLRGTLRLEGHSR